MRTPRHALAGVPVPMLAILLAALVAGCGAGSAPSSSGAPAGHYSADAQGLCKAAQKGDLDALRRLAPQRAAAQPALVLDGERFCLEGALAGRAAKLDLAAVLGEIKPPAAELNRVYASSTGMTARDVPQAEALARAAGQRAVSLYAGGSVVEATPLMWAVWSGDLPAVQALLALGADPNLASIVPVQVGSQTMADHGVVRISVTPLFEAHRLQHPSIAKLLARHGAKPQIGAQRPQP